LHEHKGFFVRVTLSDSAQKSVERIQTYSDERVILGHAREHRSIEVKRLRCPRTMPVTLSIAPVRFCICRYRRRVWKGSHDRNDRKVQPRAR